MRLATSLLFTQAGGASAAVASSVGLGHDQAIAITATTPNVAVYNQATWDADSLREYDGVKYDPGSGLWVCAYSALPASGLPEMGVSTSSDAVTWTEYASNPISGGTNSEDPYITKNVDGTAYRDGSNRAYLYSEERIGTGSGHRGIYLWRSAANSVTSWTLYGRVIDKGASGWDSLDRTSPTVIWDGSQFVMLFEGRSTGSNGSIGYATSADGVSWTVDAAPIVVPGSGGSWNDTAVVPDDLIKVGNKWVLLMHGNDGTDWDVGRYVTEDTPAAWDNTSFTEMTGNPYDLGLWAQCWGNDPTLVAYLNPTETTISKATVGAA